MKVKLFNYTACALETLLYTKDTRLQGTQSFIDIVDWPMEKKLEHLEYMKDTIKSSWEFVDYTFKIEGVTRAFTHQFVRTRTASYAQESQRTIDASEHEVINTAKGDELRFRFDSMSEKVMDHYGYLINSGMPIQDARGILPTNISTSIIGKFNLRTLHEMGMLRLCTRTQGEYQRVFKAMVAEVVKVHPWAAQFIKVHCAWYGVCAFPRYTECPIHKYTYTAKKKFKEQLVYIEEQWKKNDHEANPIASGGKTQ